MIPQLMQAKPKCMIVLMEGQIVNDNVISTLVPAGRCGVYAATRVESREACLFSGAPAPVAALRARAKPGTSPNRLGLGRSHTSFPSLPILRREPAF